MAGKKILVTGGAGFVGSHLTDALLAAGHEVRVFDNLTPQVHAGGMPDYLSGEAELMRGDMRDRDAVRRAIRGVDAVFHLAARVGVGQSMYEIEDYMGENTQGTAVLLQSFLDTRACVEKLVVASSMSIYGEGKYECAQHGAMAPPPRSNEQLKRREWEPLCPQCGSALAPLATSEDKPLQATSIYALSKKDQEEMCLLYGRVYGLPVVALRYFNIYGTRQALSNPYTGVAAIFASRLLNGRAPMIFEDAKQLRDFVSVHDVVTANLLALERSEADGQALNIGSGEPISIGEVAAVLTEELGADIDSEISGQYRAGDIRHCYGNIGAARRQLGFAPRYQFRQGVAELVEWLRSQAPEDRGGEMMEQLKSFGLSA